MTVRSRSLLAAVFTAIFLSGATVAGAETTVCENQALRRAIRVIASACHDLSGCDFDSLKQIDQISRPELLAALRDPNVYPVHIFFEANVSDVTRSRDWKTKKDHLAAYSYITGLEDGIVVVIGQASRTGSFDLNVRLSRERMQGVLLFLRDQLKIKCRSIKGGYVGSEIFQLSSVDASALRLLPEEFRNDPDVLNQSVHVFVYPCEETR